MLMFSPRFICLNLMRYLIVMVALMTTQPIFAFDPTPFWNFKDPALSEQRFLQALARQVVMMR
jgi:hypothetical protein